jgi:outer membrane protein
LDRTDKQIRAGQLPPTARFDLVAQAARDEQQIVAASNNVEISMLNLKNLLEISPDAPFRIEKPNITIPKDANPDGFIFKAIYNQALGSQPFIRADELRIKSAQVGVKIAESQLLPVLSANAGFNSNYSSTITDFDKGTTVVQDRISRVLINGSPVTITVPGGDIKVVDVPKKSYTKQLGENFGQGVGLNLSIPIFEGMRNKIGVQRQKLNVENQMLTLERDKQTLKSDVQNAIASSKAAKKQFEAAQKTYDAQKSAYDVVDKRFTAGSANSFELTIAKNNLDTAERDVIVAKYDYIFRLKIVEFYEGKKLSIK